VTPPAGRAAQVLADGRAAVRTALAALDAGRSATDDELAAAVRLGLRALAAKAPGRAVEVRVPPWGAVQAVAGATHTRGTPRAVVEMDPETWVLLAGGRVGFAHAVGSGRVRASGARSDLGDLLPL
jgi:uncharacterized SCP-like protein